MKAGFSVCDITPDLGIYLTGYGQPERLAEKIHSPLQASVMFLQDRDQEAVVISFDWCYMDVQMANEIRQKLAEATGVPAQNILLCCTHTHSAPHTAYSRSLGRVTVDPENKGIVYVQEKIPVIAEGVIRARNSLVETAAGFAAGKTQTGISRRGQNEEGRVTGFIGDPDLPIDNNMTVIRFTEKETGMTTGIFVHCSAHNTAMGGLDRSISSDWCGVMKKRIRDCYQVPVIFLNGSFGDVGPRTSRWVETPDCRGFAAGGGDGVSSAEEVGYRAAADALSLLKSIKNFSSDFTLKLFSTGITLPQEIPMSREEAQKITDEYKNNSSGEDEPPVKVQIAADILQVWEEPPQPELTFEQRLISFGPLVLIPYPFEMFSIFSLRLRKYGPCQYNLLCSNANGCYTYLPDRGAIAVGGYEVTCRSWSSAYVTKPEAGDLAVAQTLDALKKMFSE